MTRKQSLKDALLRKGFSEREAVGLILSGRVLVNGKTESRVGARLSADDEIELKKEREYPSRAAYKLKGALEAWRKKGLDPKHRICLDIGAAHGGFTKVLLEYGARRIYAIDVAYGILDYELRKDSRVLLLERRNFRHVSTDWFLEEDLSFARNAPPLFVVCDASFISLATILNSLSFFLKESNLYMQGAFLWKPQFQCSQKTEEGIVRDPELLASLREDFERSCKDLGFEICDQARADIPGRYGNQEYVYWLKRDG